MVKGKKAGDDLDILILGLRIKIDRAVSRAEPLVISPKLLSTFLDKLQERLNPTESGLRTSK